VVFPIRQIGKSGRKPCRFLRQRGALSGCRIYSQRPDACRSFRCSWLAFDGPAQTRPDRLGYIVGAATNEYGGTTRTIHELRAGAIADDMPRLRMLSATEPIMLYRRNGSDSLLGQDGIEHPIWPAEATC
jgi:hypothetical protein